MTANTSLLLLCIYTIFLKVSGTPLPIEKCTVKEARSNQVKKCQFPFVFLDKTYYGCIKLIGSKNGVEEYTEKAWCSTKVDKNTKEHIPGESYYGDCPSDCESAEEATANLQSANQKTSGHHIEELYWGAKALAKLEKCLIDDKMPLYIYRNGDCYPLFEQGPCKDGEWFVLNSKINGSLLPYAHCEKTLSCDVFILTADYEGPECISCDKNDQVPNEDGEFLYCNNEIEIESYKLGTREDLITGVNYCEDGQVKDTRGECKTAYKFSPPEEDKHVQTLENKKPRRPRNLRKYLQSRYRFG